MKRIILLSLMALFASTTCFAIRFCYYYDGYWGKWSNVYIDIKGDYSGSICYWGDQDHPSQWFFRFKINNYTEPLPATKEINLKNNTWYEYTGTVEYYISDEYQDIKSVFKSALDPINNFVRPSKHRVERGETPCVKKTAQARIKIEPYEDHPKIYNIWFYGVGVGINLEDTYFKL